MAKDKTKVSQFASTFSKLSEAYRQRYPRLVEQLERDSMLAKHGTVNEAAIVQTGAMIDKTRTYLKYKTEQGTLNDLGLTAKFAVDLVTVGFTGTPPALMANIQQLRSQSGYVWYEATKAETNAGNVEAGQTLDNALKKPDVYAKGYGVPYTNVVIGETDGTASITLLNALTRKPVRPRSVSINVDSLNGGYPISATDANGNGEGYGNGLTFTVDYNEGNLGLTFTGDIPDPGKRIYATYDFAAEDPASIPEINIDLQTKPVNAQVCALQASVGLLKQYEMQSVLGIDAGVRTAQKLAEELNREISTKLVTLADDGAEASGSISTWVKNPDNQVGLEVQHQYSLDFTLVDMEGQIFNKADRGNVTTIIGSRTGVLEPYKIIPKADRTDIPAQQGTSLIGTYGNKPLIRAASLEDGNEENPNIIGKLLGVYRGPYPWDAALVIGVHMPIISIKDIPNADKILMTKQGIATWSAFELISDAFVAKTNILRHSEGPTT